MIRRLRAMPLRTKREAAFTGESVRRRLREDAECDGADDIRRQIERLTSYVDDTRLRSRFRGMESYHSRLPSIVSLYVRGHSPDEIAARYTPVLTSYGVARSTDVLCEHVAERLRKAA